MVLIGDGPIARSTQELSSALTAARDVFWRFGFDEASMEDVVAATGLNRYAIYASFGGKRELFLATVEDFFEQRKTIFMSTLEDPDAPPFQAIARVFHATIAEMAEVGAGCFLCNVAGEAARTDPIVASRVGEYMKTIQYAYEKALRRAEEAGDLNAAVTPEAGGAMLLAVHMGIGAHSERGARKADLDAIIDTTLAALKSSSIAA